jgi:predicted RecA/RadA family phage recombinase
MKNYLGPGKAVNVTAPYAVVSGQPLMIGTMFGFCGAAAAAGQQVALHVVGEYSVTKPGSQAWTVGQAIYFDNDLKNFSTTNVSGGLKVGVAIAAVGSSASETTGKIRLNGSF